MATVRRLAAIFAADVAGYSRLMGADEESALAGLAVLHDPIKKPELSRIFSWHLSRHPLW
jgi:adenylate cyclase